MKKNLWHRSVQKRDGFADVIVFLFHETIDMPAVGYQPDLRGIFVLCRVIKRFAVFGIYYGIRKPVDKKQIFTLHLSDGLQRRGSRKIRSGKKLRESLDRRVEKGGEVRPDRQKNIEVFI